MTKLILEEGGQKRAFRVRNGRLTIGSGEGCTLKLTSSDVAEVHAELEVSDEGVTLKPRPGVLPPTLGGRPVDRPRLVPPGARFQIGSAILSIEPAEGAAPAPAPAVTPVQSAAAGRGPRAPVSAVQTSRPLRRVERSLPTWAILSIFALVIAVGFAGFRMFFGEAAKVEYDPYERLRVATEAFEMTYLERALSELDRVDLQKAPELRERVSDLRKQIDERLRAAELVTWNQRGTEFLETQIKRFYAQRLQGDNAKRERARVFVKRCQEFRETWPQHPESDWVQRYQERFEPIARLGEPPTFADVSYDVETLTWAKPRDYETAFARLRDFMARAQGADFDAAQELETELVTAREAYFLDRMQQAKYFWNKEERSKSVGELIQIILYIGDEQMADQAASEMVLLPGIDEYLRGYHTSRPDRWEQLVRNGVVREKARELGLL